MDDEDQRRHQRFDEYARSYAAFSDRNHHPLLPWLEAQGIPCNGRAIDLGCGAGRQAVELATAFDEVVGVDLSEPLVELARSRTDPPLPPNVTFLVGDLTTYEDERGFDFAFSSTALHHVPDLEVALANVARLVRPGGWAVLRDVVRLSDPRLVWIWRHGGLVVGPLADFVRRRQTWADLRFQLSAPWLRHLLADRWLTLEEFERSCAAAFPEGRVGRRPGELATLVWQRPH